MFIHHKIMLFTIASFLASKCITLKILYHMCIEFITYTLHIVKGCPNTLQSRHQLAFILYYTRISCKQNNSLKMIKINITCGLLVLTLTSVPSNFYLVCKIFFEKIAPSTSLIIMFIYHQIMLFTIISFLASKWITLKILNYAFIEFITYASHIVEVHQNGLHSRHSLALSFYYYRISCKQTNPWNII